MRRWEKLNVMACGCKRPLVCLSAMKFPWHPFSKPFTPHWNKAEANITMFSFTALLIAGKHLCSPLKLIFNTLCNPTTGVFAWVGVEDAEIIFLNDFWWKTSIIAWSDMLQLLQGDITHLPALKNFCKRNTELTKDTPVFAMANAPLILIKGGAIDGVKTEFMNARWRFFHFWWHIPEIPEMLKLYLKGPTLSRGRGKIAYRPNTFD